MRASPSTDRPLPGRTPVSIARALVIAAAVAMTSAAPDLLGSPFGVNAHIPPPEVLDAIAASGARWVRIDVLWSAVEPAPGSFHWDT